MNKMMFAALAVSMFATPALAGNIKFETRFSDPVSNRIDATEYKVEYSDSVGVVDYGVELQTKQGDHQGSIRSSMSAKVGSTFDLPYSVALKPFVEFGHAMSPKNNFEFFGAGINAKRQVVGPITAEVGYRHRQGFSMGRMNEERLHAGLEYAVTTKHSLGTAYYRTRGSSDSDAVGVFYKVSF